MNRILERLQRCQEIRRGVPQTSSSAQPMLETTFTEDPEQTESTSSTRASSKQERSLASSSTPQFPDAEDTGHLLFLEQDELEMEHAYLRRFAEPFQYTRAAGGVPYKVYDDPAARGSSFVFRKATREKKHRINLSGAGGDELMGGNYGFLGQRPYTPASASSEGPPSTPQPLTYTWSSATPTRRVRGVVVHAWSKTQTGAVSILEQPKLGLPPQGSSVESPHQQSADYVPTARDHLWRLKAILYAWWKTAQKEARNGNAKPAQIFTTNGILNGRSSTASPDSIAVGREREDSTSITTRILSPTALGSGGNLVVSEIVPRNTTSWAIFSATMQKLIYSVLPKVERTLLAATDSDFWPSFWTLFWQLIPAFPTPAAVGMEVHTLDSLVSVPWPSDGGSRQHHGSSSSHSTKSSRSFSSSSATSTASAQQRTKQLFLEHFFASSRELAVKDEGIAVQNEEVASSGSSNTREQGDVRDQQGTRGRKLVTVEKPTTVVQMKTTGMIKEGEQRQHLKIEQEEEPSLTLSSGESSNTSQAVVTFINHVTDMLLREEQESSTTFVEGTNNVDATNNFEATNNVDATVEFEQRKVGPRGTLGYLFPWLNFFEGKMRDFLMKEEMIAGAHGVETRYPFLDPMLVQEFLWLSADLKNSIYKRPLLDMLQRYAYPLELGKQGFSAHVVTAAGDKVKKVCAACINTRRKKRTGTRLAKTSKNTYPSTTRAPGAGYLGTAHFGRFQNSSSACPLPHLECHESTI
ncbi:unnamed protein product [Amoebophrya sp. A25]|nr:unnamed protein product [Amoebophrya sp. A25]|eukprot:GSA25T00026323001.1